MSIKYSLVQNYLITVKKVFMAQVQPNLIVSEDEIYERMAQSNSGIGKGEIMACMQLYNDTLQDYLKEGCYLHTRHGNYRPGIRGNFDSPTESFASGKHTKDVRISVSNELNNAIQDTHVERVSGDAVAPSPMELFDNKTNTVNTSLTPGNIARLSGSRLNFDSADALAGVFLVASDDTETKVTDIMDHTNKTLRFLIPSSLASGQYRLEVRAIYTQNRELRTGSLTSPLTVK
ncbi:MAG: DNA-binding domain-containing protein [Spirochaetota bacterium]